MMESEKRYSAVIKTSPFYQRMEKPQLLYRIGLSWDLLADGEPPVWNFKDMSFPEPILRKLTATGILPLTTIQLHALRMVLSGNHMVATSLTGPGKTLVIALSLIMAALRRLSSDDQGQGGPYCLLVSPSKENALETYRVVEQFIVALKEHEHGAYPELRSLLYVDDDNLSLQVEILKQGRVHIVVSTPGRLKFALAYNVINLANCRYLALDEAETLFENSSFRDDIQQVLRYFKGECQTVVFPAYRSTELNEFTEAALTICASVCAATDFSRLHVIQRVEYVKQEDKMSHTIDSLKRKNVPFLVICDHMNDVDSVQVNLTEKGHRAYAIHAGKDPEERADAISSFKIGKYDTMVATDAALDELDFVDIQHVIIYDMPSDIHKYVRLIARMGRKYRPGTAITYINKNLPVETLVQLKLLLQETNHRTNPMLEDLIHGIEPAI